MGKIYIFGGDGFVGRHLSQALLAAGEQVIICDICKSDIDIYAQAEHRFVDIRRPEQLDSLPITEGDVCINLAANQYHTKVPRKGRREYFFDTNTVGVRHILEMMERKGCRKLVQYTTDMTYGKPQYLPVDTSHPQHPFGPYGQSKKAAEQLCFEYRGKGMDITIFRPRMIMGPGRLGILVKLFKLMDMSLPIPMIGNGKNHYQMISVFDCVSATMAAIDRGIPNGEYNLGSKNPPCIRELLKNAVKSAGSHSCVIPTWGYGVKATLWTLGRMGAEIMYKEQYMIADEEYQLDISKTEAELNWQPQYNDQEMIRQAYESYRG